MMHEGLFKENRGLKLAAVLCSLGALLLIPNIIPSRPTNSSDSIGGGTNDNSDGNTPSLVMTPLSIIMLAPGLVIGATALIIKCERVLSICCLKKAKPIEEATVVPNDLSAPLAGEVRNIYAAQIAPLGLGV